MDERTELQWAFEDGLMLGQLNILLCGPAILRMHVETRESWFTQRKEYEQRRVEQRDLLQIVNLSLVAGVWRAAFQYGGYFVAIECLKGGQTEFCWTCKMYTADFRNLVQNKNIKY
jgi:hypothetical protein